MQILLVIKLRVCSTIIGLARTAATVFLFELRRFSSSATNFPSVFYLAEGTFLLLSILIKCFQSELRRFSSPATNSPSAFCLAEGTFILLSILSQWFSIQTVPVADLANMLNGLEWHHGILASVN